MRGVNYLAAGNGGGVAFDVVGPVCVASPALHSTIRAARFEALAAANDRALAGASIGRAVEAVTVDVVTGVGEGPRWARDVLGLPTSWVDHAGRAACGSGLDGEGLAVVRCSVDGARASEFVAMSAKGGVVLERGKLSGARVARRRDVDVLGLMVRQGSLPRRLGDAGAHYAAVYEVAAGVLLGGEGRVKLSRLEGFVNRSGGAAAQANDRLMEQVEWLRGAQSAVRAACGGAGLAVLDLVTVQGASIETALANPSLASIVRGGRGARPRGRLITLLRAALTALPTPHSGPSAPKNTYTEGRVAGGV